MPNVKAVNIILAVVIAFGGFLSSSLTFYNFEAIGFVMNLAVFLSIALYILINNEEKT